MNVGRCVSVRGMSAKVKVSRRLPAAWALALVAMGWASPTAIAQDSPLAMRVALSHTAFSTSFPETLALKIDLAAAERAPESRPLLNLALVIDQSGSMAEDGKFDYAMQAARLVMSIFLVMVVVLVWCLCSNRMIPL